MHEYDDMPYWEAHDMKPHMDVLTKEFDPILEFNKKPEGYISPEDEELPDERPKPYFSNNYRAIVEARYVEEDEDDDEDEEYGEEADYGEEYGEEEAALTPQDLFGWPEEAEDEWPEKPRYKNREVDPVFARNETMRKKFNEVEVESFMKLLNIKPHPDWRDPVRSQEATVDYRYEHSIQQLDPYFYMQGEVQRQHFTKDLVK